MAESLGISLDELEKRKEYLTIFVPRYRIYNLADKYKIEDYENIEELIHSVSESINNNEFQALQKDCIFDGSVTLFLFRDRTGNLIKEEYLMKIMKENNLLKIKDISDEELIKIREENSPEESNLVLRRIIQHDTCVIFEYDYLEKFEYRDKKGKIRINESLETTRLLFYPKYSIIAVTSSNLEFADTVSKEFSELFKVEIFVLRFFKEDLLKWKIYSSRLSSSSISIMDDEDVGTERLSSKQNSDIRKSNIYVSALNGGYEISIYSKKSFKEFELGFGINLNQGKLFFRSMVDLIQLDKIMKIASKILINRQGIKDINVKSELTLPKRIEKKDKSTKAGYKLLKL